MQTARSKLIGKYWKDLEWFSQRQISQKENSFEPLCTTINDDDDDEDDDDNSNDNDNNNNNNNNNDNKNNNNNKFNYFYRAIDI